jgi:hypothetical protein
MSAFFSTTKLAVPGLIEPTGVVIDLAQLNADITSLWTTLGFQRHVFQKILANNFNLSYPRDIPESILSQYGELQSKFLGPLSWGEARVMQLYGISTAAYTEMHDMVKHSYIKEVVDLVHAHHQATIGPAEVQWVFTVTLGVGGGYKLHTDMHTAHRYHVCLETNEFSFVMVKEQGSDELQTVHIPADGRVWLLDTLSQHSAWNLDPKPKNVRTHLVISLGQPQS